MIETKHFLQAHYQQFPTSEINTEGMKMCDHNKMNIMSQSSPQKIHGYKYKIISIQNNINTLSKKVTNQGACITREEKLQREQRKREKGIQVPTIMQIDRQIDSAKYCPKMGYLIKALGHSIEANNCYFLTCYVHSVIILQRTSSMLCIDKLWFQTQSRMHDVTI